MIPHIFSARIQVDPYNLDSLLALGRESQRVPESPSSELRPMRNANEGVSCTNELDQLPALPGS